MPPDSYLVVFDDTGKSSTVHKSLVIAAGADIKSVSARSPATGIPPATISPITAIKRKRAATASSPVLTVKRVKPRSSPKQVARVDDKLDAVPDKCACGFKGDLEEHHRVFGPMPANDMLFLGHAFILTGPRQPAELQGRPPFHWVRLCRNDRCWTSFIFLFVFWVNTFSLLFNALFCESVLIHVRDWGYLCEKSAGTICLCTDTRSAIFVLGRAI